MSRHRWFPIAVMLVCLAGCGSDDPGPPPPPADDGHAHNHPSTGVHGGHLIELGEEEYHGEWLHYEDGKVTVFILNGEATADVSILAKEVQIVTQVADGDPRTHTLAATAVEGDDEDVSRFEVVDLELVSLLGVGEGVTAELVVEIDGKEYRGKIENDHGHDH